MAHKTVIPPYPARLSVTPSHSPQYILPPLYPSLIVHSPPLVHPSTPFSPYFLLISPSLLFILPPRLPSFPHLYLPQILVLLLGQHDEILSSPQRASRICSRKRKKRKRMMKRGGGGGRKKTRSRRRRRRGEVNVS